MDSSATTTTVASCTRCGYRSGLVKCTNCERAYCLDKGQPDSTGCLTIREGSAETLLCTDCHQARYPGATYPHDLSGPRLRVSRHTLTHPSEASLDKHPTTLRLNMFFGPSSQQRAEGLAHMFTSDWRSRGWNLRLHMFTLGEQLTKVTVDRLTWDHYTECRSHSISVFLIDEESGVWQEHPTPSRFIHLLQMANEKTKPADGFAHHILLATTGCRGLHPQWLLDAQQGLIQNGIRGGNNLIAMLCVGLRGLMEMVDVFVKATINGLDNVTMFQRALEQAWALASLAGMTDLHIWATGTPPILLRGVEFHKKPWEDASLCPSCSCPEPPTSVGLSRSWKLDETKPVDSPTLIKLKCTWCERVETRTAPPFPKVSRMSGTYLVRLICGEDPPRNNLPPLPEAGPSGSHSQSSKKRKRPNKQQKVMPADPSSSK